MSRQVFKRKINPWRSHGAPKLIHHFKQRMPNGGEVARQGAPGSGQWIVWQWLGNPWGKSMPDQSDFSGWVCTKPFQLQLPVSRAKNVLFLVQGGHLFQGKFYHLLLGRKGEFKKLSLHLLFLKCLQLTVICHGSKFWGGMFWTPSGVIW